MTIALTSDHLPPVLRLALAYAPREAHGGWLAAFALDARLAALVRHAREPILAQIKLAWWRDRLGEAPASWPAGEPLLDTIRSGIAQPARLGSLVDGWEAMLAEAPLPEAGLLAAAEGRARGLLAAAVTDQDEAAQVLARRWALADLAAHLSHPEERARALALHRAMGPRVAVSARVLRPLVVIEGLASRSLQARGSNAPSGLGGLLLAMRLGLLGR
jgi:phytoene synthase